MEKNNLTNDNYFEDKHYMSCSLWKKFRKCEFDAMNSEFVSTPSMLIGSYVDAYVEGTLDKFKEENADIFCKTGANKGELKSEFRNANLICDFIDNDTIFSQFFKGEKQVIRTGTIGGVPFKGKFDNYDKGIAINDLKVLKTVTDNSGEYYDFISQWGYHYQMAIYQELEYQYSGVKLPMYICVVTKESPMNSLIVNIPQDILDTALYEVETSVKRYYDIYTGKEEPIKCEKCNTCISSRKETKIISMREIMR